MSTQSQPADQADVRAFLEKLAQFHATLSPADKALLDEMTAAAVLASQGEVQGFALTTPLSGVGQVLTTDGRNTAGKYYYYYNAVNTRLAL